MTQEPPVNPNDAPFSITVTPTGWDRFMTQEEADAANILYPVPPYGPAQPVPPPAPPAAALVHFVLMNNIRSVGAETVANVRPTDLPFLPLDTIFPFWPIAGVLGIVDDVGVRPARVRAVNGNDITLNYDSQGLNITGLVLVGVVYTGPQS